MGNTFARLFPFSRRGPRGDASRIQDAGVPGDLITDDDVVVDEDEPLAADRGELEAAPVLLPAAIHRQLLYDPAEITPVWARPRPAPAREPAISPTSVADGPTAPAIAASDQPKPATRTRRPKADATTTAPARPRAKRSARKDLGAADR